MPAERRSFHDILEPIIYWDATFAIAGLEERESFHLLRKPRGKFTLCRRTGIFGKRGWYLLESARALYHSVKRNVGNCRLPFGGRANRGNRTNYQRFRGNQIKCRNAL